MKNDEEFLKERQQEIENERKRLNEQFMMLNNSIQQTENEAKRMDLEKTNVLEKQNILEKSIMSLHTKTKEIRDDIINHASQQKTIEKSSANLLKQTKGTY
jgi:predicted nuclease with TOPRIM domain